ncbi:MAG: hypothetical protein ACO36I_05575, partial [Candidatus Latescibacterota bacterium]
KEDIQLLQETAVDQQLRLEQAQALSVSILNNIPFPVCVIDAQCCIWMSNPAFRMHFTTGNGFWPFITPTHFRSISSGCYWGVNGGDRSIA